MAETSLKFTKYNPEKVNSIVIEITDHTVFEETKDEQMPTVLKDQKAADDFINEVRKLCLKHGFMINLTGTREQMAARLYKKDGKDLITEEEAVAYAYHAYILVDEGPIPTIEDLHKWRKEVDDMK